MRRWLLPEYIEDILPAQARQIEALRRRVLDLFQAHGYELVMPPLLEYLESLLTGTGHDLDLKTFKLVDQLSGRLLGVRADITPQVARIDAHLLNRAGIARLCYAGSVLHALPSGMMHTREPLQVGAELYGHAGVESDVEIQALMVNALRAAGVADLHVDLGHVGVFRCLMRRFQVAAELESELFQVLQTKDLPALRELVGAVPDELKQALLPAAGALRRRADTGAGAPRAASVSGARHRPGPDGAHRAAICARWCRCTASIWPSCAAITITAESCSPPTPVDGPMPSRWAGATTRSARRSAARARRPASAWTCASWRGCVPRLPARAGSSHPTGPDDAALRARIDELRAQGEIVILDLPGHDDTRAELGCTRTLTQRDGGWQITPLQPAG